MDLVEVSSILAGAAGVVLGAVITYVWRFSERSQERVPATGTPAVPPDIVTVLSVLRSSALVLDRDERVLRASAAAIGLGFVTDDDRLRSAELLDLVRQVRRYGEVREAEFEIRARRRPPVYVRARVAPLSHGLVLALVEDRTTEQRVEALRRDFVANVSHELKTPIGAISLLAEAVGEARDDPEAVERFAARMQTESERLTRLVQQIIDLSRLQADVVSDDARTVKVDELVAEAVEHSRTDAEAKGIEITQDVQSDLHVRGDRAQLHAAVSNLVENAVTYSPAGSAVAVAAVGDGQDVRITVSDHGVGIAPEEQERIFERFYRVDPARARATGGTGLGLSIVKHVAASNGGTVEVWSEPGLGSSFTLVLPARDIDEGEHE
ncbi:two-component sensor histidine kinase [Aeromicrobium sp. 636]|uniref:Sensor-like histidine kinase SenX3 n=1 Tax=Aeromicrobium senzhongii TaxID=2663859 RepID=A0A8I0EW10_9ACTN|nr:two-component sensor histidine kinase [Aeromicrobium senzhongii]MCQ3998207.1 two-component sensor histidine kinase [Aeromicrobium sp. 636]MTB88635.1 two-component sensor histidine kinase [Aeromicrobium senzhongii]QNL96019.1 two-component sensor histidine kinase [Aeromicrobium senzhongii]